MQDIRTSKSVVSLQALHLLGSPCVRNCIRAYRREGLSGLWSRGEVKAPSEGGKDTDLFTELERENYLALRG